MLIFFFQEPSTHRRYSWDYVTWKWWRQSLGPLQPTGRYLLTSSASITGSLSLFSLVVVLSFSMGMKLRYHQDYTWNLMCTPIWNWTTIDQPGSRNPVHRVGVIVSALVTCQYTFLGKNEKGGPRTCFHTFTDSRKGPVLVQVLDSQFWSYSISHVSKEGVIGWSLS